MAAPTTAARVKKALANPEPSTHGPWRPIANAAACPQPAKADAACPIRAASTWEKVRTSGGGLVARSHSRRAAAVARPLPRRRGLLDEEGGPVRPLIPLQNEADLFFTFQGTPCPFPVLS